MGCFYRLSMTPSLFSREKTEKPERFSAEFDRWRIQSSALRAGGGIEQ